MSDCTDTCEQHKTLQDSVTNMKDTQDAIAKDVAYTRGQVDMMVSSYEPRLRSLEGSYRRQNWALVAIVIGALLKSVLNI